MENFNGIDPYENDTEQCSWWLELFWLAVIFICPLIRKDSQK